MEEFVSIMLSDKVIKFIQQNAQLIEKEKFDDLFWECKREAFDEVDVFQLKNVLLASDIDPLEKLTVIPQYYFHEDTLLTSFVCKPQVKIIEASAFYGSTLKKIELSNVFELGSCSLANCKQLTDIYLPDTVHKIFPCCFERDFHLEKLSMGKYVKILDNHVFADCIHLTHIRFRGLVEEWDNLPKCKYWNEGSYLEGIICDDGVRYIHSARMLGL